MDEMKIESEFMTTIISKLMRSMIRKKTGYDIQPVLNSISATVINGKIHLHLDAEAELSKEELLKILKNTGL